MIKSGNGREEIEVPLKRKALTLNENKGFSLFE